MKEVINHLNNHYNWALGENNSTEFYLHIRDYIDIIITTPELSTIFSEEAINIKNKINEINDDPLLNFNLKEESIDRLKMTGLYSDYIYLLSNVYSPIEDHNRGVKYHSKQTENNLFYISGIENIPKDQRESWSNSFSKHKEDVENRFISLHNQLINLIEEKVPKNKSNFFFNPQTGEFKYYKTEGILSPKSREFKFLKVLYTNSDYQATYEELLNKEEKANSYDKNMLVETARVLRRKLNIRTGKKGGNKNIIKSISKYGYKLSI